jgi:DNA-directed RNA polymerase subunit RPC12/RpoP
MPRTAERITGYRCLRCNHLTVPRNGDRPKRCGKCKSPYWDKPKVRFPKAKP